MTVLLGATQAGKTTLMRVMAGLDAPSQGPGAASTASDVTGVPVRERNVAMVYQQFINYPSMTVADNIASPLKLRGEKNVDARVRELAAKLHIELFLDRLPAELSGGQQQRVALARALAKNAPLMLLDEPLVNLDYKLREELREELTQLFATGDSTVVYATTEPDRGAAARRLHRGARRRRAAAVRADRRGLPCAAVDPRRARLQRSADEPDRRRRAAPAACSCAAASRSPVPLPARRVDGADRRRARQRAARRSARDGDVALPGKVELAEISGSDTFVHVETAGRRAGRAADRRAPLRPRRADHAVPRPGAGLRVRRRRRPAASRPRDGGALTWPASTSTWRTPTSRTRSSDERLRAAAAEDELRATAAPTRCSAPRAAARRRMLNIISGLVDAVAGQREVRRRRRHARARRSSATSPRCSSSR